jgi:hypothetical protein
MASPPIQLRALGITLARLPGEYRVNFRYGTDETALTVETLDEALDLGRSMTADVPLLARHRPAGRPGADTRSRRGVRAVARSEAFRSR